MPRDPNVPDAFDVYTVVVLRRPADAPEMSEEDLDALQARHLAYRADLVRRGLVVVNGIRMAILAQDFTLRLNQHYMASWVALAM